MDESGYELVARIVRTHGLNGEVSVAPAAEAPFSLLEGVRMWVVPPLETGVRSVTVTGVRPGPKGPLVALEGFSTIDDAAVLTGRSLLALTQDLPDEWLEDLEGEADALGLNVVDVERGDLGTVEEVILTGANDVWVVRGPLGEILLPVIDDVVLDFDPDTDTVSVRLLDGLLPGEDETA